MEYCLQTLVLWEKIYKWSNVQWWNIGKIYSHNFCIWHLEVYRWKWVLFYVCICQSMLSFPTWKKHTDVLLFISRLEKHINKQLFKTKYLKNWNHTKQKYGMRWIYKVSIPVSIITVKNGNGLTPLYWRLLFWLDASIIGSGITKIYWMQKLN